MPVWPFMMAIAASLALWGWRHDAWQAPAIALVGYFGMRCVIEFLPQNYHEVAGCAWWLIICCALASKGNAILPAMFYALSALTYPVCLLIGHRIVYMGLSPIIAEVFALLALFTMGWGISARAGSYNSDSDIRGPVLGVAIPEVGVAQSQGRVGADLGGND